MGIVEQKGKNEALEKASYFFGQKILGRITSLSDGLDIGTGNGYTAFALSGKTARTISIDSDSGILQTAASKGKEKGISNIEFVAMDAHALEFADESFDIVTCRAAVHHFDDPQRVLSEVFRVLRKNGSFVLMDFVFSDTAKSILEPISKIRESDFRKYFTFHEYCELLESVGFTIQDIQTYTLPRIIEEWASGLPSEVQTRLVGAVVGLSDVLNELGIQKVGDQHVMRYRIIEFVSTKQP